MGGILRPGIQHRLRKGTRLCGGEWLVAVAVVLGVLHLVLVDHHRLRLRGTDQAAGLLPFFTTTRMDHNKRDYLLLRYLLLSSIAAAAFDALLSNGSCRRLFCFLFFLWASSWLAVFQEFHPSDKMSQRVVPSELLSTTSKLATYLKIPSPKI